MIDAGYIYVAQPPLYQIKPKGAEGQIHLYRWKSLLLRQKKFEHKFTIQAL